MINGRRIGCLLTTLVLIATGLLVPIGLSMAESKIERIYTIPLGVPIPLTGPYAADGEVMQKGISLAVQEINNNGGVLGKQIDMKIFDIGDLTPDKLQASAAQLLDRDKVVALINGYGGMGPDIPAYCPYKEPYLNNDGTTGVMNLIEELGCTNIFNAADVAANYGKYVFEAMQLLDIPYKNKKVAIVNGPYDFEVEAAKGYMQAAKDAGWEVVFQAEAPYGTTQWSGILSQIAKADPAIIHVEIYEAISVSTFYTQYKAAPIPDTAVNLGYFLVTPAFEDVITSGAMDGVYTWTTSAQLPWSKGIKEFENNWRAAFNEDPPYSGAGTATYDMVNMWAAAVEKVGNERDFEKIIEVIKTTPYVGLTGKIVFDGGYTFPTSDETQPSWLIEVKDGKLVPRLIGTKSVSVSAAEQ